jgi:glycosyltransferase involved in cell wall biosynthesis
LTGKTRYYYYNRMMKGFSAIIPAYNEETGIAEVISELTAVLSKIDITFEIIVVNDGSTDRTGEILKDLDVILLDYPANRGYGASLKDGIKKAQYDNILILDADGTYPQDAIPALIAEADRYDMVVGSRTGGSVAIPPHRKFPKWLLRKMADYLVGMKIPDLNSGLRIFKKNTALKFFNILPNGFSFTTTITVALLSNNYRVKYIPINYNKRTGKSKFRPIQDTFNLLNLILRTSLYFNPLKIFVPFSLILFLLAVLVFIYSKFFTPQVMDITIIVIIMTAVQILALGLIADLVDKRTAR